MVRAKYAVENSWFGYGHAKQILLEVLIEYLRPYRERREKLLLDIPFVEGRLAEGKKIMNARLEAKMREVCRVVGIN
jgi:tryptophanyl-tRNA synthetase